MRFAGANKLHRALLMVGEPGSWNPLDSPFGGRDLRIRDILPPRGESQFQTAKPLALELPAED